MRKIIILIALIVALCAGGLLRHRSFRHSTAQPAGNGVADGKITVTDMAGRVVSFHKPVQRIVLIRSRDIYEVSLLLGDEVASKIVGWGPDIQTADKDAYRKFVERYPGLAKLPVLGAIFDDAVNIEAVLALKPDLVILDTVMAERGYKSVDRMEQAGLPLLFLDLSHDPFHDPERSLLLLGKVLGKEDRAAEIVAFVNAELDRVFSRLPGITTHPPVVYLEAGSLGAKQYGSTYGFDPKQKLASWGTFLDRLHCRNIAAGVVPSMGPISPEYLLKTNPEVIVITGANWPALSDSMHLGYYTDAGEARDLLRAFTTRPGWDGLSAVKNHRVYSLFHGFAMHLTNFAAVQQLAKWLYPETFADLDPEGGLREFHRRFMPVSYSGVWMVSLAEGP